MEWIGKKVKFLKHVETPDYTAFRPIKGVCQSVDGNLATVIADDGQNHLVHISLLSLRDEPLKMELVFVDFDARGIL